MQREITDNTLYYGDNLPILREHIGSETVDLIYLDPPFNSNRNYNVLFREESGQEAESQITAFEDTWHWNDAAAQTYHELTTGQNVPEAVSRMIAALHEFIGSNQMMAYLVMMAARLVELHRVLKPTGSLYLHCDPTASHYLKVILDTVFDPSNFRNEIIWHRYSRPKGSQHKARRFGWSTDTILFYSRSDRYYFDEDKVREPISEAAMEKRNTHSDAIGPYYSGPLLRSASMGHRPNLVYEYKGFTPGPEGWRMTKDKLEALDARGDLMWTSSGKPRRKVRPQANPGNQIDNLWADIGAIASQGDERLGYPTQKPIALLERIIQASSKAGDAVLDPFCGCGTAIAAAQKHGRRWIGIDITHLSIALQKYRLAAMFPGVTYRVVGEPDDVESARQLAQDPDGRYKFQWWALSLIKARPLGGQEGSKAGRKGSDSGIDGVITFMDDNRGKPKRVLVQAKSGGVKSGDIRDLVGTLDREKAAMGVFITLEEPRRPMLTEASAAGVYQPQVGQRTYPRVQILTVADLLSGAEVKMPPTATTFKQAQRADDGGGVQAKLAL